MSKQRMNLLDKLESLINSAHKLCISKAQEPIAYVECPFQHDEEFGPHLHLDKMKQNNIIYCKKVNPKQLVPKEAYNLLVLPKDRPGEFKHIVKIIVNHICIMSRYRRTNKGGLSYSTLSNFR